MRKTYYDCAMIDARWVETVEKNVPEDCRIPILKFVDCVKPDVQEHGCGCGREECKKDERNITNKSYMWYSMYHYIKCGKQDYELTDGLAWWLANTDNTDVDCKFVQSPFRTIYVMIPTGILYVKDVNPEADGNGFVDSFFLTIVPDEDFSYVCIQSFSNNIVVRFTCFILRHGFSVRDEINRHLVAEGHHEFDANFFKFVFNILLYCTSAEPDESWHPQLQALWNRHKAEKKPKRKARLLGEIEKIGKRKILGGKIIISREDREDFKEAFRTGNNKIGKRFMVAGHWRNQPYGAKHALRKKLFIQPYWKGPEDAEELLNRIRQVGKQKSLGTMLAEY